MELEQNGQGFDLTTNDGKAMHLVRRAGMRSEEFIAHAHRFAASDELFAACEAYVATMALTDPGEFLRSLDPLDKQIRVAVAKARGV